MASNLDILVALWDAENADNAAWTSRIPTPSRENFNEIKTLISHENYEPVRNEIYGALINRIGKVKVWQQSITNPFALFKNGTMTYGDTFQEIMSDIIEGETFRIGKDDQFEKWNTNVFAAYHRINREQFYPVTIEDTKIIRAFNQEGGFQALINSIVNQMYSSNDLDEFIYTKRSLVDYYNNTEVPLQDTQVIEVPDLLADPTDRTAAQEFILNVKSAIKRMKFPSRAFNAAGVMMETKPSDFVLLLRSEITVIEEVMTLANMFHPQYMDISIPIIDFDTLDDENIVGIILDKQAIRILDTLRRLKRAENARNLYEDYYYHVHQLYAVSPFRNVIYLVKEEPVTP